MTKASGLPSMVPSVTVVSSVLGKQFPNIHASSRSLIRPLTRAISASTAFDTKRRAETGGRLEVNMRDSWARSSDGASKVAAPAARNERRGKASDDTVAVVAGFGTIVEKLVRAEARSRGEEKVLVRSNALRQGRRKDTAGCGEALSVFDLPKCRNLLGTKIMPAAQKYPLRLPHLSAFARTPPIPLRDSAPPREP